MHAGDLLPLTSKASSVGSHYDPLPRGLKKRGMYFTCPRLILIGAQTPMCFIFCHVLFWLLCTPRGAVMRESRVARPPPPPRGPPCGPTRGTRDAPAGGARSVFTTVHTSLSDSF